MVLALILATTMAVAFAGLVVLYVKRNRGLERQVAKAVAAQSTPEPCIATIVVIGDSTAVGVGADSPSQSIAGRIAIAFPAARVLNYSKSGAKARDIGAQMDRHVEASADVVLVQACANDVVGVHSIESVEGCLRAAIRRAQSWGAAVLLMPGSNLSIAPYFWPATPIVMKRVLRIHAMMLRVAADTGAVYVDLIKDVREDPFKLEPQRYFCSDGLHPSGEGYAVWFEQLMPRLACYVMPARRP